MVSRASGPRLPQANVILLTLSVLLAPTVSTAAPSSTVAEVTVDDLLNVHDLSGLELAPDNRHAATYETWAAPDGQGFSGRWMILDLPSGKVVASAAVEHVLINFVGLIDDARAVWSPDSQSILFRVAVKAGAELRRLDLKDNVTTVEAAPGETTGRFAYAPDGRLVLESLGTSADFLSAEAREAARGTLVEMVDPGDPIIGNSANGAGPITVRYKTVNNMRAASRLGENPRIWRETSSGVFAPGGKADGDLLALSPAAAAPGFSLVVDGPPSDDRGLTMRFMRLARHEYGKYILCKEIACRDRSIELLGIDAASRSVVFTRTWPSDTRGLYMWDGKNRVRTLAKPTGNFSSTSLQGQMPCRLGSEAVFCIYSDPTTPPEFRRYALANGAYSTLLKPNKRPAGFKKLEVRQVQWQGPNPGLSSGVLVLPKHRIGKLPLVVTSYRCRGYLRGGVGFDTPEYVLASKGIAALCVAASQENLGDSRLYGAHRRLAEELASGAAWLGSTGLIDLARTGVSGRSMSAEAVAYSVSHDRTFTVASLPGYSIADPLYNLTHDLSEGSFPRLVNYYHRLPNDQSVAEEIAPALNAKFVRAPILFQVADTAFRNSLQFYYALKTLGKPVEMVIYPNELHQISQPRHMRLNAVRNIDWFDFWLRGQEDADPAKAADYRRWRALRGASARSAWPSK